ncbi:Ribonuclease 3 [Candidatus Desulfarcum epimagneticum]|uniref:Ribonuclease 3 n=1 Tax=uncultured Desulfobacteraceae bacterium TaxID=218296 RepID=A0A484HEK1_9BACT|nr:Ribonuclease 3 [uncultured Desulfobacteraceae bacterium]
MNSLIPETTRADEMDCSCLEKRLGHSFENRELLKDSLRHSSYVNESGDPGLSNNERLEFLGDAAVNLIVGHCLMRRHPHLDEGDLSRMRAGLVNESGLAKAARRIGLGSFIMLGRGERRTRGAEKDSILADAYEALVAAVYLDGGFERAFEVIEKQFESLMPPPKDAPSFHDPKTRLQELAQEKYGAPPHYRIIHESGPPHDKIFDARVDMGDIRVEGSGKSKKTAEQNAAKKALEALEDPEP